MDSPYDDLSSNFQEFYYWCISEDTSPSVARARDDIPFTMITVLQGEELEIAKELLLEKLKTSRSCFYISALMEVNDRRAIPLIRKRLREYKRENWNPERDFRYEIKLCRKAIRKLKYSI